MNIFSRMLFITTLILINFFMGNAYAKSVPENEQEKVIKGNISSDYFSEKERSNIRPNSEVIINGLHNVIGLISSYSDHSNRVEQRVMVSSNQFRDPGLLVRGSILSDPGLLVNKKSEITKK